MSAVPPTPPVVRFLDRSTPPHIATLVLLSGLSAMAINIFLPSLPGMTAYFGTDYRVMQLSVALYLAVNAGLQVIIGPLADRYGRRPVLLGSIVIFCLATVGCLLAANAAVFLAFRTLQAVIVSGLVLSRAIVRDMVPADRAASMIGYVTMGMALVPMLSPMAGGVLDEAFGWRANFLAMLLAGCALWLLTWRDVGETGRRSGLTLAGQFREYPQLFASRRFWGYALAAAFASGAFFAFLGGAPLVGTQVYGLSPGVLGIYFGLPAVGYLAGNYLSGRFSVRAGINRMMLAGALLVAVGMLAAFVVALAGARHPAAFFGFMVFVGLGNGLVLPNATAGLLSVRPHLAGTASGLGGSIMIGGGAALSGVAGALLTPAWALYELLAMMSLTALAAVLAALYVIRMARVRGPLGRAAPVPGRAADE